VQGELRKDSYIEMAGLLAGVDSPSGRSNDYYRLVGSYRSSEEYNDEVRRDARSRSGDDLQARADYYEQHRIRDELAWYWSSLDDWERYQDKRRDSNKAFKRAGTMIGVALGNRLLAAVDAGRPPGLHSFDELHFQIPGSRERLRLRDCASAAGETAVVHPRALSPVHGLRRDDSLDVADLRPHDPVSARYFPYAITADPLGRPGF
jgi:hypothetical protein